MSHLCIAINMITTINGTATTPFMTAAWNRSDRG